MSTENTPRPEAASEDPTRTETAPEASTTATPAADQAAPASVQMTGDLEIPLAPDLDDAQPRRSRRARHRAIDAASSAPAEDVDSTVVRRRALFTQPEAPQQPRPTTSRPSPTPTTPAPASPSPTTTPTTTSPATAVAATPEDAPAGPPARRSTSPADTPRTASSAASTTSSAASASPQPESATSSDDADAPMRPVWRRPSDVVSAESTSGAAHLAAEAGTTVNNDAEDAPARLTGPSEPPRPRSRAAAHWMSVLAALVLLPVAWFALHDGAAHLAAAAQPHSFGTSLRGLLTLLAGCLALGVALYTAGRSSLGTTIVGTLTTIAGLLPLTVPVLLTQHLTPVLERTAEHSALGTALVNAAWNDAVSGRLLTCGVALLGIALAVHGARRAGRREQAERARH